MKTSKLSVILSLLLITNMALAYTGEVVASYPTPGKHATGLTYDGVNLWLADRETDMLYCISPLDGRIIRSLPSPGYWTTGLTWDGNTFWIADLQGGVPASENYNGKIYQQDYGLGNIVTTIPAPSSSPMGLAWDGRYLWCADNRSDEILQFSPEDGTTIQSFKSPSGDTRGLTFDGTYLWASDRAKNEIYMIDPQTGTVVLITDAPGEFTRGLAFDGTYLWAVDEQEDMLYKLKVRDEENFIRSDERHARVTYRHHTTNFGPGNILTADIHLAIPRNRDSQEIVGDIRYSIPYSAIVKDKWGQETAHFHFEDIPSGERRKVAMITEVKTYAVRYFIYPDRVGTIDQIPQEIKDVYLEDNEKYQIDHPVISDAVKNAVGEEKNAYWIARKIFDYINERMYYEMVGGWNTAPTVLARGNGSCSEYTFVYISMCRAAGLAARYVGSVVVRGDDASTDDVFHRWVEVYLPGYGWIPVDPSRGDRSWPADQASAIGSLSNSFLITTQSGGGSETMGWTYNSNEFWTAEPKTNVAMEHFGDWEPVAD